MRDIFIIIKWIVTGLYSYVQQSSTFYINHDDKISLQFCKLPNGWLRTWLCIPLFFFFILKELSKFWVLNLEDSHTNKNVSWSVQVVVTLLSSSWYWAHNHLWIQDIKQVKEFLLTYRKNKGIVSVTVLLW